MQAKKQHKGDTDKRKAKHFIEQIYLEIRDFHIRHVWIVFSVFL